MDTTAFHSVQPPPPPAGLSQMDNLTAGGPSDGDAVTQVQAHLYSN